MAEEAAARAEQQETYRNAILSSCALVFCSSCILGMIVRSSQAQLTADMDAQMLAILESKIEIIFKCCSFLTSVRTI